MKKFLLPLVAGAMFSFTANATQINIKYSGVKCPSCVKKFTKAFNSYNKKHGGDIVTDVKVNWKKLKITVHTKDDKDITDKSIRMILKDKGYNLVSTSRKY